MKKFLASVLFVVVGSGMWWMLSNTARFSIKRWDGKFESVLRDSLSNLGIKDANVVSSVNQLKKDNSGEWVVHAMVVKVKDSAQIEELKKNLENAGAQVSEATEDGNPVLVVKRGKRTYQEIRFIKP